MYLLASWNLRIGISPGDLPLPVTVQAFFLCTIQPRALEWNPAEMSFGLLGNEFWHFGNEFWHFENVFSPFEKKFWCSGNEFQPFWLKIWPILWLFCTFCVSVWCKWYKNRWKLPKKWLFDSAEMSFAVLEMSFTVSEISLAVLAEMSFALNAQKKPA